MVPRTLNIEIQVQNTSSAARLTLSGFATYAHVEQVASDPDGFDVTLDDHLAGDKEKITSASTLNGAVDLARTALLARARDNGIEIDGLEVVSD